MAKGYWGVFLDDKIEGKLKKEVVNQHITFGFDELCPEELKGKKVTVTVIGYGNDGRNEGYLVDIHEKFRAYYHGQKQPHITISLAEGARAVNTGKIHFEPVAPFKIEGRFGEVRF